MSGEMVVGIRRRIAIGETGTIIDIRRSITFPRQRELTTNVQRIALIVIEEAAAGTEGKVGETAVDTAAAERELIRIGEIKLRVVVDVW